MLHNITTLPDQKKNKDGSWLNILQWLQISSNTPSSHSGFVCSDGQCSLRPVQTMSLSSAQHTPFSYIANYDEECADENNYLSSIFPPDYYEAMKQAAKLGFLYSFVAATPAEFFSNYFKARGLTPEQKYYANQTIRAVATLSLSACMGVLDNTSLCMILGVPVAAAGMKYAGFSESATQLLTIGTIISAQILSDTSSVTKTLATFFTAAASGWVGNKAAKMSCDLIHHRLT